MPPDDSTELAAMQQRYDAAMAGFEADMPQVTISAIPNSGSLDGFNGLIVAADGIASQVQSVNDTHAHLMAPGKSIYDAAVLHPSAIGIAKTYRLHPTWLWKSCPTRWVQD